MADRASRKSGQVAKRDAAKRVAAKAAKPGGAVKPTLRSGGNPQVTQVAAGVVHEVPEDLRAILISDADLLAKWNDLTPIQRNEWICWTTIVKKPETRAEHARRMFAELKEGQRQPCCWPGCPHRRPQAKKWFKNLAAPLENEATAKAVREAAEQGTAADPIAAYARAQPAAFGTMCDQLRGLIDAALPKATSKVWHGSPVWFIDDNPVVGYSANRKAVNLLFWNGQALGEESFEPVGKYGAAQAVFADAAGIHPKAVRRWLKWAGANVFDSKAFFKKMREKK